MKIKFTHDFRGTLTNELFYESGTELDVDDDIGAQLIALDHAVEVQPEKTAPPRRVSKPKAAKTEKAEIIEATDGESA